MRQSGLRSIICFFLVTGICFPESHSGPLVSLSGGGLVSLALVTSTQFPLWFLPAPSVRFGVTEDVFAPGSPGLLRVGLLLCHKVFRPQS